MFDTEQEYWVDIAEILGNSKHKIERLEGGKRPSYFKNCVRVVCDSGEFNLGTLLSDSFFDSGNKNLGEPRSKEFAEFVKKLSCLTPQLSNYHNVIIMNDESLEADGLELYNYSGQLPDRLELLLGSLGAMLGREKVSPKDFKPGEQIDKVLLLGIDYLIESAAAEIKADILKVDDSLAQRRYNLNAAEKAEFIDDVIFFYATNQQYVQRINQLQRRTRFFYDSIPDVKQKTAELNKSVNLLLNKMGLNLEQNTPFLKVVDKAFSDGTPTDSGPVMPFENWTYMWLGGKARLFAEYIIGTKLFDSVSDHTYFNYEDVELRTQYDKKTYARMPGIIFSVMGEIADEQSAKQNETGIYAQAYVSKMTSEQKQEILERALEIYKGLSFSDIYYKAQYKDNPYSIVLDDLEWAIACLDATKLKRECVQGRFIKEGKMLRTDSGKEYPLSYRTIFNEKAASGTQMKAFIILENEDYSGDVSKAVPFEVSKEAD